MRRSKWKGLYTKPKNYTDLKSTIPIIKVSRNSSITPKLIEQTFRVHNGKYIKNVTVLKEMLGHKFGEFFKTRATFEYKKKKKKKK